MSLLKLPEQVLGPIFAELEALALYRLLQTCPRMLWVITSGKCVYRFSFRFEHWIKRLPRLFSQLLLLRDFCVSGSRAIPTFSYSDLLRLPKTLQRLELSVPESMHLFLEEYKPPFDWLLHNGPQMTNSPIYDVAQHFTHLTTLILDPDGQFSSHKIVSKLPHTLTHLQIFRQTHFSISYIYSQSPCDAMELPPYLRVLKLYRCNALTTSTNLFHLAHLEIVHLPHVAQLDGFGPSVKEALLLRPFDFLRNFAPIGRSLEKLSVMSGPVVCPPSVTDLCIYMSPIEIEDVKRLGQNVTRLSLPTLPSLSNISFPASLKWLEVPTLYQNVDLSEFAMLLPASLEHLSAPNLLSGFSSENARLLPPGLEYLAMGLFVTQNLDLSNIFPKMRHLTLTVSTVVGLAGISLLKFPPRLSSLELSHSPSDSSFSILSEHLDMEFPETLRSLIVCASAMPCKNFLDKRLPPGLTRLHLSATSRGYEGASALCSEDLSQLPKHLTDLEIELPFLKDFSSDFLRHLPRDLTRLRIKGLMTFCDEDVPFLPRRLREIAIRSATLLTDACTPHLPPNLQTLDIRHNRNLTPAILKWIPASLMRLDIRRNRNWPWPSKGRVDHHYPPGLSIQTAKYANN